METAMHGRLPDREKTSLDSTCFRVVRDESPEPGDSQSQSADISRALLRHAQALARDVAANAILVLADAVQSDVELRKLIEAADVRTILVSRNREIPAECNSLLSRATWITVPDVHMTRNGQVKVALLVSLAKGLVQRSDRVVCLTGVHGAQSIDSCLVLNLETEPELFSAADIVLLSGGVSSAVFERALMLATQLATEGREGRPIGALFVIGDSQTVLSQARQLVLNPFHGYPESERNILDPNVEETIKEFSSIDGAFIIRGDGVVLAAGMQLVPSAIGTQLPKGLGTRHAAACAITASSAAVAIAISQSTGTISIFKSGEMITDIHRPTSGARIAN